MPYTTEKRGDKTAVVNANTGKVMGMHDDPEKARRQMRALMANVKEDSVLATALLPPLREVETFSKPGTADVTPADRAKLSGLLKYYAAKAHPFTECQRDQIKHGLSEDHAARRCAVLKDIIRGTTKWRGNEAELTPTERAVLIEHLEQTDRRARRVLTEEQYDEAVMVEATLTSQARKNLPESAFVFPKERRYPIHDVAHARNALARSSGKPEEATVRRAVCSRYKQLCKNRAEEELLGAVQMIAGRRATLLGDLTRGS